MPGQKPRHFNFNYFVTMIMCPYQLSLYRNIVWPERSGDVKIKFYFAASPVAPAGTPVTVCTLLKAPLAATA